MGAGERGGPGQFWGGLGQLRWVGEGEGGATGRRLGRGGAVSTANLVEHQCGGLPGFEVGAHEERNTGDLAERHVARADVLRLPRAKHFGELRSRELPDC